MSELNLNFQDTATAFADKTDAELQEKYRMFKMMNSAFLTSIGSAAAEFALALGLPVKGLIKETLYKQFCGGETIEECQPTIEKLGRSRIGTILDYSVEGKSDEKVLDQTKTEIRRTIERAGRDRLIPFAVFKVTGLVRTEILEKVSAGAEMNNEEREEWERGRMRVFELCEYAHSIKQPVFIDAEESWLQDAIDRLATEMMENYNREAPIVYNTLQMYRHDRLEFLKKSHGAARENNYFYAVKLVRGAYMEKERERAEEHGYPSPIQPTKEATDRDFDAAVEYCLDNIETVSFIAGTHNEQSTVFMTRKMEEKNIARDHSHANFSQLYGMSDNLSYVLAKNGYNVSKYVPYGPVKDTVPYLIRRAEENSSVMGQTSRELEMIARELKRRGA